jgi:hypothetical protein
MAVLTRRGGGHRKRRVGSGRQPPGGGNRTPSGKGRIDTVAIDRPRPEAGLKDRPYERAVSARKRPKSRAAPNSIELQSSHSLH